AVIAAIQGRGAGTPRQAAANLVREARRYLDVKDARMAIAIATRALDLDPKNAAAYHVRAVAQSQTGRLEDSVRDASLSLALVTPKEGFPALKTRAWAYNGLRKFDDALKDSLQAKSIKPGDGFVLMTEARALGGLGRREEMVSRLKEAAAAEPDRYQGLYEAALELPSDADTETLFTGLPASARGGPAKPSRGGTWHKLRLLVYCLAGGLLIALGLSHKDVAERATTTARRLLTGAPAVDGAEPAPAAPAPATNFWSRYDGAREIAKGGMGIVFEATDKNLGRRVAVKKMREELRTDPRERERFLKEARTVASLQHPNVVQIFEVAEDGLDAYLVFEYVDGETLHDRLRRLKRLTLPDTAKILAGVCAAVECAHGRAMTHRDLKPSNIMIDRDGRVKVMDFGIARHAKDALTKLSMTNTVCGTPPYMAPEQEQGMVCKESDVFSLGVLAYELLSGTLPFEGAPGAMLLAKMSGRYEPVSKRVKDLPAGVDDPLARALCPDPAKRYRRPSELAAALEALSSAVRA
ncbi:MAG: protein kinase, partial [Elusimicrobia bacterium]|nr:protein kinase [Elusimicrobiota bacterium]